MSTANFNSTPSNASDAAFRAWGLALHNAIAAILTYVSQTGEIDFTTVSTPSSTNQKRGFRVYRFNDALQSTHPVFIRVDFGSGAATTTVSIWIQIGQAVDGSGNLSVPTTGALRTTDQAAPSAAQTVAAFDSYVCGSTSRLTFVLWPLSQTTANNSIAVTIERSKDINGADTAEAVHLIIVANTMVSVTFQQNGRAKTNDALPFKIPFDGTFTTAAYGRRIGIFPTIHYGDCKTFNAITGFLIYSGNDYLGFATEPLTVYGTSMTYLLTERGLNLAQSGGNTTRKLAVRND
jgi:hypothetical protein